MRFHINIPHSVMKALGSAVSHVAGDVEEVAMLPTHMTEKLTNRITSKSGFTETLLFGGLVVIGGIIVLPKLLEKI